MFIMNSLSILLALVCHTHTAPITAFEHVTVIPMDRQRTLKDQTVIVTGDKITYVGSARRAQVPPLARRIDGTAKFLMPGLADMHVHLYTDDGFPREFAKDELAIMIANGVTTARLMNGSPFHLQYRKEMESTGLFGPSLLIASPQITGLVRQGEFNGFVVTTPEEARSAVQKAKEGGYDFIKLTEQVGPSVFDSVIDEAKKVGLKVSGHVDPRVGVERALAAGQQIEHIDGYMEAVVADDSPMKDSISDRNVGRMANWESIDHIDLNKIKRIAKLTARAGSYCDPTLNFWKLAYGFKPTEEEVKAWPDNRFIPAATREAMVRFRTKSRYWTNPPSEDRRKRWQSYRNMIVLEILKNGGKIMAGSDAPDASMVYGWSLHRELVRLVEAGLTPFQALEAATKNPAEWAEQFKQWGSVSVGKRADLVLLNANPLENITNTEKRVGVMVRGDWRTEEELQKQLDEIADRWSKAPQG